MCEAHKVFPDQPARRGQKATRVSQDRRERRVNWELRENQEKKARRVNLDLLGLADPPVPLVLAAHPNRHLGHKVLLRRVKIMQPSRGF